MPNPNGLGWFGNAWRGGVDRLLPGTQRSNDGRLIGSRVATGLAGRAGSFLAGMAGGPLAAAGANRLAGNMIDNGNPLDFSRALIGMPTIPRPELNVVPRGFEWTTGSGAGPANPRQNFGGSNLGFPGAAVPTYQPRQPAPPSAAPQPRWNSADIGLNGGVFNGGAPNLGQNAPNTNTARGFSGIGPIVPGYLAFSGSGSGGINPFARNSKMIR